MTMPTMAMIAASQLMDTLPVVRATSAASSTPIVPDQRVIGMTAARVMTSHLPTVSRGSDCGGLAVCMISAQAASRVRTEIRSACFSWMGDAVVMDECYSRIRWSRLARPRARVDSRALRRAKPLAPLVGANQDRLRLDVHERDAGDDQRRSEHEPSRDGLAEEQEAKRDAPHGQRVRDERGARRPPAVDQPIEREVSQPGSE